MAVNEVMIASRRADRLLLVVPAFRMMLPSVFVIVAYLLIGLVAFWPAFPLSQHISGGGEDFILALWFLNWAPMCCYGLNPFFSQRYVCAERPEPGAEQCRSIARPDQRGPLALVFSPVVGANLLALLAMPVSATAAFLVLRMWHVWHPAAALGGLIYGFSPYMVGHGPTHLSLIFVPLPPFIAFTVASILQGRGSRRRLGIQLGLLVTAQFLICPEVVATVAVLTIAAVGCVAVRHPAKRAPRCYAPCGVR